MRRSSLIASSALLLLMCGCGESDEKTRKAKHTKEPAAASEPADQTPTSNPSFPYLSDDNAEAFLRDYLAERPERNISLTTRHGTLKIELFDDTPLHTANFLMMIEREYFDGTEFTRIAKDFVVQGGNSESETDEIKRLVIGNYLIPSEIREEHIHKKGALAMARSYEDNPDKMSSAYDFYIITGQTFNEPQLMGMERQHEMTIPEWKRKIYRTEGGAPHLDGQHTVFGQVTGGYDVLEKMNNTPVDESNWPLNSLTMEMEILDD